MRALAAYVALVAISAAFTVLLSTSDGFDWSFFRYSLGSLAVVQTLWFIGGGLIADHLLSRFGATLTLVVHIVGASIAFFVALAALYVWAAANDLPPGGPLAFAWVLLVPPLAIVVWLAAWLVPGSFPRGHGPVLYLVRRARPGVRRALSGVRQEWQRREPRPGNDW